MTKKMKTISLAVLACALGAGCAQRTWTMQSAPELHAPTFGYLTVVEQGHGARRVEVELYDVRSPAPETPLVVAWLLPHGSGACAPVNLGVVPLTPTTEDGHLMGTLKRTTTACDFDVLVTAEALHDIVAPQGPRMFFLHGAGAVASRSGGRDCVPPGCR